MKTKIRKRLDHYTVHCPTCGTVPHGSEVRGARRESTTDFGGRQPSTGIVPSDRWESWATDLEIDRGLEDATR